MAEQNNGSVVLEGIYKGLSGKIEEVNQSLSEQMRRNAVEQANAFGALEASLKGLVESLMKEIHYLSQQNSAIFDCSKAERAQGAEKVTALQDLVQTLNKETEARMNGALGEMRTALEARLDEMRDRLAAFSAVAPKSEASLDYDALAESIVKKLKERDGDALAESIVKKLKEQDGDALLQRLKAVQDKLEESVRTSDEKHNALCERLGELSQAVKDADEGRASTQTELNLMTEKLGELADSVHAVPQPTEFIADEGESEETEEYFDIDYDLLAEKISTLVPETDYDMIADRVASALPRQDEKALTEKILSSIPQVDEALIADKVADIIPLVDYDAIADRVRESLTGEFDVTVDEHGIERIASRLVSSIDRAVDYERIGEAAAESVDCEEIARRVARLLKGELAAKGTAQSVPTGEEDGDDEEEEVQKADASPVAAEDGTELTTRYKRSFLARIIQSEEEVKGYYSRMKNAMMGYARVSSQINWSNDRFALAGDTVAKIGVNGRTLCLYLALDPAEFPTSVYHQKYEGDKKMYEKTPMMIKVKSDVALKRALRLIALLMEKNGAVEEGSATEDYAAQYPYRSDEELLSEGLIKTSLMVKSDLDF